MQRIKPYAVRVDIELILTPPDRRRRDADNLAKASIDLLKSHLIIPDDSAAWVRSCLSIWSDAPGAPGVTIVIRHAA